MTELSAISLVLDQGVPRDSASQLRERGYQCIHVGEIGMQKAGDDEILALAAEERSTVVTLDADFHTILAVSGRSAPSVIRIRLEGLRADDVVEIVERVLTVFGVDLLQGALVTVKARKTTCHRLPIGQSE